MFDKLIKVMWGERLSCYDPLFGHLVTQRVRGRGRPIGDPPQFEWFSDTIQLPEVQVTEVVIHAGRDGPSEEHRRTWHKLIDSFDEFRNILVNRMFEIYLSERKLLTEYCRKEYGDSDLSRFNDWPKFDTAGDTFENHATNWHLDIYADEYLEFYIPTLWDGEHNLIASVRGGQLEDLWKS